MKNNKAEIFTIFGHKGFFGSNLVKYLKKKNKKIFLPVSNKTIFKNHLGHVIYCFGTHEARLNPKKALAGNLSILSEIILNNKFKSFTYLSSIRVYSSNKDTKEDAKIVINQREKDIYFKSLKLAAENLCLQIKNPKIKVARISNIYGYNFKNQKYLLPTLIRNAKQNKKIIISINKNTKKNYLHVNDAIDVLLKIIKKGKKRLYNIASDKMISLSEIIQLIKKDNKLKITFTKKSKNKSEAKININRIKKEFNFIPKFSFQNEIGKIIREF